MALLILKKLSFIDLNGNDVSADITQYIIKKEFTCDMCGRVCMLNRGLCLVCSELKRHYWDLYTPYGAHLRKNNMGIELSLSLDEMFTGSINVEEHYFACGRGSLEDLERDLRIKIVSIKRNPFNFRFFTLGIESIEALHLILDYPRLIRKWLLEGTRYQNTIIFRDPMVDFVPI